ncbi:unnamed protein product [Lepeophtheirus salmonis]|uniref:(salmon louse) hypothetical protein n=1 Tax=Lepeophtheirus salmonis TaxID=72036 RepID=A0A7R8H3S3_LEPSM|nr:unnamed protein product [Lepeophtheirus salmonis]CAF2849550.1 unnamed protein product [Lepeophtheirus salmonis]
MTSYMCGTKQGPREETHIRRSAIFLHKLLMAKAKIDKYLGKSYITFGRVFPDAISSKNHSHRNSEGIDRVIKKDGAYAYFMESALIEYNSKRNCELTRMKDLLDSKGYGFAFPLGVSLYTCHLSRGSALEDVAQLGLPNLSGVFIVLLAGVILSYFNAVCEFGWTKRHLAGEENLMKEMFGELKFTMDCTSGDTQPIAKSKSLLMKTNLVGLMIK